MSRPIDDTRRPGRFALWSGGLGHWLLITIFGLPLVTPLLRLTGVPCTHDGHLYYHRIAAMRYAWEKGLFFSRWQPDVVFGYGYPYFNYREALPLYLSLFLHLLGLQLPAAINLFYVFCILAAGWFMYLWVRDVFGPVAGIVAAVAYMAAPYQLIDALIRGNQPESLALALFPLLLWAGRRFILRGAARPFLIATLGLGFLALSHNISLLLFMPFLTFYLLVVGWWERLAWRAVIARLGLLIILGLGLAALYIGPALLELDAITISRAVSTRGNSFRFNFTSLSEIFAPVSPADPTQLNAPLLFRLGLVPLLLSIMALLGLRWSGSRERRGHIMLMAATAVLYLFMSLPASKFIWQGLPLIKFVQFPWRLVGRAALPVAFLTGVPVALIFERANREWRGRWAGTALAAVALALLLLEAIPLLYPRICQEQARPTIQTVHAYEHETGFIGVDPEGHYFPVTAGSRPDGSPLEADYQAGRDPQRLDRTTLPDGAIIEEANYGPTSARLVLTSPSPFQARYLSYAFPGWKAKVAGQPVPITAGVPDGLITFSVPAGQQEIEIWWGSTPLRTAMTILSALSLAAILVVTIILARYLPFQPQIGRQDKAQAYPEPSWSTGPATQISRSQFALLIVLALALPAFKMLVIDKTDTLFRRPISPAVSNPVDLSAAELHLEGYNLSREKVPSGDSFDIDLAWLVEAPPAADYQSHIWITGPAGATWSDKGTHRPRTYEDTAPTRFWQSGQWAWDSREVLVLPGTPPGTYDIVLTLFDLADLRPVTLIGAEGAVLGPSTAIGQIEVARPADPAEFEPQYPRDETVSGLSFLGFNQDRDRVAPGEGMLLTFFWQKPDGVKALEDSVELELVDESDGVVQSWQLPPVRADYPPDAWAEGERFRGQHLLRPAPTLESGAYRFRLSGTLLGEITVVAPDRLFEAPPIDVTLEALFDDRIILVGYSLSLPRSPDPNRQSPIPIILLWQGLVELPTSYRVFVHLVDDEGQILAQSDGEPAGWTRPTTGWVSGEYIVDRHELTLPEGANARELSLRVGLYDARTGTRLRTNGDDFVLIPLNE